MTSNQISYMKYREDQRHNVGMEQETFRHDVAQEVEANRSNLAREAENARANTLNYNASIYASQASMYNAQVNAATQRYSAEVKAQTERYVRDEQTAVERRRLAQDDFNADQSRAETIRHNKEMENISAKEQGAKTFGTATNVLNALGTFVRMAAIAA